MKNLNTCEFCLKHKDTTGAILNGKYGQACRNCRDLVNRVPSASGAQWHRDRDREDNLRDLIQPWSNGKPNTEFIRNYPEQAKDYFTQEQLETYG